MGKIRDNAILLDLGCCVCLFHISLIFSTPTYLTGTQFGQDIRALIADGYPSQNIIALDVNRGQEVNP